MGIYRQVKDKFIMKNAYADWENFRGALTDLVLSYSGTRIAIIGAGRCNDIDILRLLESGRELTLIDTDSEAMSEALFRVPQYRNNGAARKVTASLNGISEDRVSVFCENLLTFIQGSRNLTADALSRGIDAELDMLERHLVKNAVELENVLLPRGFDIVLCNGVCSQMFSMVAYFLQSVAYSLLNTVPQAGEAVKNAEGRIGRMNTAVIPHIIRAAIKSARCAVVFGNENIPNRPVEGAAQCINFLRENYTPREQTLTWPFNPAEHITYDMLIQTVFV